MMFCFLPQNNTTTDSPTILHPDIHIHCHLNHLYLSISNIVLQLFVRHVASQYKGYVGKGYVRPLLHRFNSSVHAYCLAIHYHYLNQPIYFTFFQTKQKMMLLKSGRTPLPTPGYHLLKFTYMDTYASYDMIFFIRVYLYTSIHLSTCFPFFFFFCHLFQSMHNHFYLQIVWEGTNTL